MFYLFFRKNRYAPDDGFYYVVGFELLFEALLVALLIAWLPVL